MLVDAHGKPICPTKFASLEPLVPGLYFGATVDDPRKHLVNPSGQEIECPVPVGCELVQVVFPPGFKSYSGTLPKDTILEVSKLGLRGLVELSGKIVVPLEYQASQYLGPGILRFDRISSTTGKKMARLFDMRTKRLSKNEMKIDSGEDLHPAGENLMSFSAKTQDAERGQFFKWGFRDLDLNIVIPAMFESGSSFIDGLAVVRTADSALSNTKDARAVFIDKTGQFIARNIAPQGPFNTQGFAIASFEDNPKVFGLINRRFEFVIKPGYEMLSQVTLHTYAAKKTKAAQWIAIDERGNELYKFPKEIVLFNYFNDDESNPNFIIASMPTPAFTPPEGYKVHDCLLDEKGTLLIPPKYYLREVKFGMVQAMVSEGDQMLSGVLDTHGAVQVPFQISYLEIIAPNVIIKTIRNEMFDSAAFKSGKSNPTLIAVQFSRFLKQYDLIGMSLDKCRELLGKGTEIPTSSPNVYRCRYHLSHVPDAELEFDHRVLKRWRLNSSTMFNQGVEPPWLTENMVFEPTPNIMHASLIKKVAQLKLTPN